MGRYNNKRTQAAAEALKNTPSRARFSKGPPRRNNNKRTNNKGKTHANTAATARVIDKIQNRQQETQQQPRLATTDEALKHVDKSKFDKIHLPNDVMQVISTLLENLGIKETEKTAEEERTDEDDMQVSDDEQYDEDDDEYLLSSAEQHLGQKNQRENPQASSGYSEYDDDIDENDEILDIGVSPGGIIEETDWEGDEQNEEDDNVAPQVDEEVPEHVKTSKAFLYLTQTLSFSEQDASRACIAIEDWDVGGEEKEEKSKNEAVALAMDWLCLHCTESTLTEGFKPNKNQSKQNSSILASRPNIKVIPHPSISVAKSITSDKEWSRNVRIQGEIVKFVQLGFHHAEASKVCENIKDIESLGNNKAALLELLEILESTVSDGSWTGTCKEALNQTDLDYAAQERDQEIDVLKAIYEEQLEIVPSNDENEMTHYVLKVLPTEDLQEPARSADCRLQVFPRRGYPVVEPPLLLFSNPSLPPSLLRRINDEIARKAIESIGTPVVFEIVSFLSESLPQYQKDFIKEQRKKEFDAEQVRIRKLAGHDVVAQASEADVDGKLGRRQRAKLKAAEKAYDRDEQIQKQNEEFRQRQEERIRNAREENSRIRMSLAERTVARREQERITEEAERAARSAMNDAFLQGKSVDEARKAAEDARIKSLKVNGVVSQSDPEVESEDEKKEPEQTTSEPSSTSEAAPTAQTAAFMERLAATRDGYAATATPTTTAFMDRLRKMYEDAAKQKVGLGSSEASSKNDSAQNELDRYHLSEPNRAPESTHIPRPVAIPKGELGEIMDDIIHQQQEQPWLISSQARAPTISAEKEALSSDQAKRQNEISKALRLELEKKRKAAATWASKNPEQKGHISSKKMDGFSPQRFHSMLSVRERLPACQMASDIVSTIKSNQVTVIAGDTGCGKTTQVPQLVLDDLIISGQGGNCNIIVTQPRRISAIGVSERIADERCEKVGDTCGYSIKLEKKMSSRTRLLLCTTGILLRRLQVDPDIANVTHVFVDEVHERDLNTDFLIIILKDLLARRTDLKLVLMSATLNSDAFSAYFGNCPVVSIPGRTHPVTEFRLEDILEMTGHKVEEGSDFALPTDDSRPPKISKSAIRKLYYPKYSKETIHSLSIVNEEAINYPLLADLLEHITLTQGEGAILVFMPGMMEITKAIEEMYKKEVFQSSKVAIYPLHSSLSTAEQKAIFDVPPEGVRKIVVSTNIAETSITIEDVVYVVDSGRVKENRRDEINETPVLLECWVSRASAKQRRGRAGRVKPGIAYHMYSSHTHDQSLQDYQLPEMLRVGIEDLVLQILILDLGEPTSFLSKALNPPSKVAMSNSLKLLETLGAVECQWQRKKSVFADSDDKGQDDGQDATCGDLEVNTNMTALGFHLATLPVDPRVGKMMIYGSLFCCVDPALSIAASMSARSPFLSPFDQREEADQARRKFASDCSDHLTILNAYTTWKDLLQTKGNRAVKPFLKENFLGRLSLQQIQDLRKQFYGLLKDIGFLNGDKKVENTNSTNTGLLKAVLCAGLYPNIIVAPRELAGTSNSKKAAGEHAFRSHTKGDVHLHPSSIVFTESKLDSRYCCYHEMVKTSKTYVRDCTTVSPLAILLFGGKLEVFQTHGVCSIDGWLKFQIDAKPATLIKYLRSQMERILLRKIVQPDLEVLESEEGRALIESISTLFQRETEEKASIPDRSGEEIVRPWTGSDEPESSRGGGRGSRGGRGGRGSGRGRGGRNGRGSGGRGGRSGRGSGRG